MKQFIYFLIVWFSCCFITQEVIAQRTGINKVPQTTFDVGGHIRGDSSLTIGPVGDTNSDSTVFINNGKIGVGTLIPQAALDISFNDTIASGVLVRNGNHSDAYTKTQIAFGWNGLPYHRHHIRTRHHGSSLTGNAIEFYVWQPGDATTDLGSHNTLTLDGNKIIVNNEYTLPTTSGTSGQTIITDALGNLTWTTLTGLTHFAESQTVIDSASIFTPSKGANQGIVLQPLGTGHLSANKTDTTSVGGNARGIYAVDWQMRRENAAEVASGSYSVIAGGYDNGASGWSSSVAGGYGNQAIGHYSFAVGQYNVSIGRWSSITGGLYNTTNGDYSSVLGGGNNTTIGSYSSVAGGRNNTASSYAETVLGSYATTYTAASATAFSSTDYIFRIGNGTGTADRSDAFQVRKDGRVTINEAYHLPTTDGTANGQIITTDGLGNLSWTTPLVSNAQNGLQTNSGFVKLGGSLTENTTIATGAFNLDINLNNTGDFTVQDNGTNKFTILSNGLTRFGGDVEWRDESTSGTSLASLIDDGDDGRFIIRENGSTSVDLDANTQFIFNEQGLDRNFRVESDGNANMFFVDAGTNRVGIGTNSPQGELDIGSNVAGLPGLQLRNGNSGSADTHVQIAFSWSGLSDYKQSIRTRHNGGGLVGNAIDFYVWDSGSDAISALGSHRVLSLNGNQVTINDAYTFPVGNGSANQVMKADASGQIYWATDAIASDIRLKKDFEAIPDVLQKLEQINGYTYHYKDTLGYSSDRQQVGLIAQELQKVLPQLVDTLHKGEDLIGINYAQLTAFLVEVSKAQQAQLANQSALYGSKATQQEQRMNSLEAENAELKAALNNLLNRMEKIEAAAE